jgi:hypothetical protein
MLDSPMFKRYSLFGLPYEEVVSVVVAGLVLYHIADRLGRKPVLFGVEWFVLTLLPVANVIPTGVLVAERTLYLPSLGVCCLAASVLVHLVGTAAPKNRRCRKSPGFGNARDRVGVVSIGSIKAAQARISRCWSRALRRRPSSQAPT